MYVPNNLLNVNHLGIKGWMKEKCLYKTSYIVLGNSDSHDLY